MLLLAAGAVHAAATPLRAAVVPIIGQAAFLSTVLAPFLAERGVRLELTAIHGREVVRLARAGEADLVIMHARFKALPKLRRDGVIAAPVPVFANPVALLTPVGDPAGAAAAGGLEAALRDPARLRRSRDLRAAQLDVLTALTRRTPGPLILGGDLNTPPRGPAYRALRQAVGPDAFQRAGRGPGWTYPGLGLRIDHQFSRDLRASRARVLPWTLSDHLPLLVEYRP